MQETKHLDSSKSLIACTWCRCFLCLNIHVLIQCCTHSLQFISYGDNFLSLSIIQAWSIIFHSVLSFFLLFWALAIWVLPIGTMRGRCLWTSLPLVLYAEALICITFVYGMNLNEEELPSKVNDINLEEIGFLRKKYQCLVLAGEVRYIYTYYVRCNQIIWLVVHLVLKMFHTCWCTLHICS